MKKPIELSDISRYRGELMGLAMLFVMLFHVWMPKSNPMYGLVRCGNVGVDIFLLLSGVGLWFSWTGNPSPKRFFVHRFQRVYPAWLVMACLFYIPNYISTPGGGYSPDVPNLIANILVGWSFWRIDDLTFWFVPSIMVLYVLAPGLHGSHKAASRLQVDAGCGDGSCRHGAVLSAGTPGRRPP